MQYKYFINGEYSVLTDPENSVKARIGVRNYSFVEDLTLTEIGFSGFSNTDWTNVNTIASKIYNSKKCREGIRDGDYVIDIELTETGFDGIENTDWENVFNISDVVYDEITYRQYYDGSQYVRVGIRNGYYVRDITIIETGFDGIENTDWENIYSLEI